MQASPAGSPVTDHDLAESDLGPLAWVLDELRKSLDSATKSLRRYVRDADPARSANVATIDTAPLRMARQHIHQAVGALEMVGLVPPANVLRSMEAAVQKFLDRPELCTEAAAGKLERCGFALAEYLESVLGGKPVSAVSLFPQYRDVQELAGADRVHPADLWPYEWRWVEPDVPSPREPLAYGLAVRSRIDQAVLRVVKSADPAAAAELSETCLGLAAAQGERRPRTFWKVAGAYFEALSQRRIPADVYVKRATSRILLQYATLARGEDTVSERLTQDLLFFCAQANTTRPAGEAPVLAAVRQGVGLNRFPAVDYEAAPFGRFDPAVLAQARKRIDTAKDTWSALSGGDASKIKSANDQFHMVGESLVKLHPPSVPLAQALNRTIESVLRTGKPPGTELSMEVATAVLFLEAAFEDLDPSDPQLEARTGRLAERLEKVRSGGQPEALEPWMEELYRRVSDKQTMGTVVGELRTSLGELEKSLDQFFRNPREKGALRDVPGHLSQMRGVLSVLGLDQAAQTVLRMRESVEHIMAGEGDGDGAHAAGSFEKLGTNLGAMGFLIDMLNYQPALAKKLFVFDDASGELRPLMGRTVAAAAPAAPDLSHAVRTAALQTPAAGADAGLTERLAQIAADAALADQPELARTAKKAAAAVSGDDAGAAAAALNQLAAVAATAQAPALVEESHFEEDDLLGIFLDEAREVAQAGKEAIEALSALPSDMGSQTTLRRAFHTLKGSSRMVGLNEFGDAAWSLEQLFNNWLAEQKPVSPALLQLSGDSLEGMARWVEDIAIGADAPWRAAPFQQAAQGFLNDGSVLPMNLPDAAAGPTDAPAPVSAPAPTAEVPAFSFDNLGFDLDLGGAPPASAPADFGATAPMEISDIDFDSLAAVSNVSRVADAPAQPLATDFDFNLPSAVPEPSADAPLPELEANDFALPAESVFPEGAALDVNESDLSLSAFQALADAPVGAPAEAQLVPEVLSATEDVSADGFTAEPAADLVTEHEPVRPDVQAFDLPAPVQAAWVADAPVAEDAPAVEEAPVDDQVKVIDSLRISLPLYNVYLNEADEWSRRLVTELAEWALELHQPLPDSAVGLAHSLAGSSGTVGFTALSEMARELEHALQHAQLQSSGTERQGRVFSDVAEDIRRLLHQFAAGFLKEPNPAVVEALRNLQADDAADEAAAQARAEEAARVAREAEAAGTSHLQVVTPDWAPQTDTRASFESNQPLALVHPESDAPQFVAHAAVMVNTNALLDTGDDDIDAVDALDPDLFPIFEEEAAELLPQLGGAVRQWAARPGNTSARAESLRALHTLKGSARLAGALRLGEMAHRMESEIEALGHDDLQSVQVEPLLTRFDALQANFDALRRTALEPEPAPQAAVEERAEPVVSFAETGQPPTPAPAAARTAVAMPATTVLAPLRQTTNQAVRVRSQLLDRLVTQAGEVMITRSRLEAELGQLRGSLNDLTGNLDRLRSQLRDIELQAETQMQSRLAQAKDSQAGFDPLEFDRFTRVQELTRMMAESVNDVATVQRNLQRTVEATEDDLIAQARQTRELQRDLLRTRMVEFEGISERLYRVVRQASKDTGKQVKLDIIGGSIEMDRGVLDRMTPAFEHLLRNCVAHGVESPDVRTAAGKDASGTITIELRQEGNDVSVSFRDDGAGLDLHRIREKAKAQGLLLPGEELSDTEAADLIFLPGFSTASEVSELAGRGIGMDVVRSEVTALGGRIETTTQAGQGAAFRMVLPLTTAVTQVVMLRSGAQSFGVPSNLVEIVRRAPARDVQQAYNGGTFEFGGEQVLFFWSGALLQASQRSSELQGKTLPVVVFRSAQQRVALHVDEVLGNQEVVVKNLGPQLSRLPGLAGMTVLASGAVVLIYNPVALAAVYGAQARSLSADSAQPEVLGDGAVSGGTVTLEPAPVRTPLVLVVDDSITVRRVTQRLLQREGYRVALAADGLQALERLQEERPSVVLSDIEMPRMDGFDLARNIRGDANLKDLPIIMITSRIAAKHREHAMELGVNHYLGKPYPEEELLSLVRRYASIEIEAVQA